MFQNMLMTSLTPLNSTNEIYGWENRPFTQHFPETKILRAEAKSKIIKKKPKRKRASFTTEQLRILEEVFTQQNYIKADKRQEISDITGISDQSIKVWFQNRRIKMKRDLEEKTCDDYSNPPSSTSSTSNQNNAYNKNLSYEMNTFREKRPFQNQVPLIDSSVHYFRQSKLVDQYKQYLPQYQNLDVNNFPANQALLPHYPESYNFSFHTEAGYPNQIVSFNNLSSQTATPVLEKYLPPMGEQDLNFFDIDLNYI